MVENGKYKLTTEKRLTALETNYVNLEKKVDDIRLWQTNHFEHFKDDLEGKFVAVDLKVESCKSEILDKIEKLKGLPPWAVILFSFGSALLTGLTVWVLTH